MIHKYEYTIDRICFTGFYIIENPDDGLPIFSVTALRVVSGGLTSDDLMLVIDPRIVHEIEANLLEAYRWNS